MSELDKFYLGLQKQLSALLDGEDDMVAAMANMSSFIYYNLQDINWAGFYFVRNKELILGPFQGKIACGRIALGQGVCGVAALEKKIMVVDDVENFSGHIACDCSSRSEIVIPIVFATQVRAVLDIDSPLLNRFSSVDAEGLIGMVDILLRKVCC